MPAAARRLIPMLVWLGACAPPQLPSDDGRLETGESGETGSLAESGEDETSSGTPPPDLGPEPSPWQPQEPEPSCHPFAQDCPAGQKCVPYASGGESWDANKCVPIMGEGKIGEACWYGGTVEATDDCGADSHCWDVMDVDGQLIGVCTPFCQGSPDDPQCPPGRSCLIANEASITLCLESCDPLAQDCSDGLGCFWAGGEFECIFYSQPTPGDACGFVNDCYPGQACVSGELLPSCNGSSCCAGFCNLDDPQCLQGTACVAFFEPELTPAGYEHVGLCVVP